MGLINKLLGGDDGARAGGGDSQSPKTDNQNGTDTTNGTNPPAPDATTIDKSAILRKAVQAGTNALGAALRSLILNGVHDGTPARNQLENAFEAAKNAVAKEVKAEHLDNLIKDLKLAVTILSNRSLKDPADLDQAKEAHAAAVNAQGILNAAK